MPTKKKLPVLYQCSKGHRWASGEPRERNALLLEIGMAGKYKDVCPHCLNARLRGLLEACGQVTEAKENDGKGNADGL